MNILEGLNQAQREAVMAPDGPLLMLAGAGSGKTKTLVHRIAYLVADKGVSPSEILAVTFTNKAAGEMRERILRLLGRPAGAQIFPFMGTFHSVCVRILRREAANIGFPTSFVIYDDNDSVAITKDVMKKLQLDEKVYNPRAIRGLISQAKNELITPAEYEQMTYGPIQKMAALVYPVYQAELKKAGAMDFDDLIMRTVELFRNEPKILNEYQKRFRYIFVDEYQDTNTAQYELVHLLAKTHKNICVVGDDWQSIYSWRGANYRNILNFERDWPEAQVVRLEQNYRSTQNILDAAHQVIAQNTNRSDKKLWTDAGKGQKIFVEQLTNEITEGHFIIQTIERLIREDKTLSLNDFAILYRVNAQSRPLEETFLRHNLPYRIVGGVRFYARKEIKDALCYLRFLAGGNDSVSWTRVANLPPRGLGERSLARLADYALRNELTLLEAMQKAQQIPNLTTKAAKSFVEFAEFMTRARLDSDKLTPAETLEYILKRSGYLDWLDDGSVLAAERVENIKELISVAKTFDKSTLDDFLSEIALLSDIDNTNFDGESVTMMSVHAAKGLEFAAVFIVGMEEGLFPHANSIFDAEQLEEERRLCYVGMTRAKQYLFMLNAATRLIYGATQHNAPSRFLSDIPTELIQTKLGLGSSLSTSLPETFEEIERPHVQVGDRIYHEVFGEGIVTFVEDEEAEIAFEGIGQKRLNLNFAPLKKT